MDVVGDIFSVTIYFHPLPKSTLYGPVEAVAAERQGEALCFSADGDALLTISERTPTTLYESRLARPEGDVRP